MTSSESPARISSTRPAASSSAPASPARTARRGLAQPHDGAAQPLTALARRSSPRAARRAAACRGPERSAGRRRSSAPDDSLARRVGHAADAWRSPGCSSPLCAGPGWCCGCSGSSGGIRWCRWWRSRRSSPRAAVVVVVVAALLRQRAAAVVATRAGGDPRRVGGAAGARWAERPGGRGRADAARAEREHALRDRVARGAGRARAARAARRAERAGAHAAARARARGGRARRADAGADPGAGRARRGHRPLRAHAARAGRARRASGGTRSSSPASPWMARRRSRSPPCIRRRRCGVRCGRWRGDLRALPPATPDGPLRILAGDFNATLDHAELRRLLDTGYEDAAARSAPA